MSTVSPASPFMPFDMLAKTFAARLRGRMHRQSFVNTYNELHKRRRTPHGVMVENRVHELNDLRCEYMKTFSPIIRNKALHILQTLPMMAVDEDDYLRYAVEILRVTVHFKASHLPIAFNLLNHFTRHSYLLSAFGLYQITLNLRDFDHPQCREALLLLLPRMRETMNDLTPWEGALMICILFEYKISDAALETGILSTISKTFKDIPTKELIMCIRSLKCISSSQEAIRFLCQPHVQEHLCMLLSEATLQFNAYKDEIVYEVQQRMKANADYNITSCSNNNNSSRVSKIEYQDEASVKQRQEIKEREAYREAVYNNLMEVRILIRELSITFSTLQFAPRRIANELTKAAFMWNDQIALTPSILYTDSSNTSSKSNNYKNENKDIELFHEEIAKDLQQLRSRIPRLTRRDLCNIIYSFRRSNYCHKKALQQLSSRVASMRDESEERRLEQLYENYNKKDNKSTINAVDNNNEEEEVGGGSGDNFASAKEELERYLIQRDNLSMPLIKVVDATKIIETFAYFKMSESFAIVDALLEEIVQLLTTCPISEFRRSLYRNNMVNSDDMSETGTQNGVSINKKNNNQNANMISTLESIAQGVQSSTFGALWTLSRLMMSLTRLHYLTSSPKVASINDSNNDSDQSIELLQEVNASRINSVYKLITCPVIYDYIATPRQCNIDIKLTSSLLRGLMEMSAELYEASQEFKSANRLRHATSNKSTMLHQQSNINAIVQKATVPWGILQMLMKVVLLQPSNVYITPVIECMSLLQSHVEFYNVMFHHLPVKDFETKFLMYAQQS